jgi:hypothetical protein
MADFSGAVELKTNTENALSGATITQHGVYLQAERQNVRQEPE